MSELALANLKLLKKDMEVKGWVIDSFIFRFKKVDYIVLVKLYSKNEKKDKYALVKLEFLRKNDIDDNLEVPANSKKLMADAKTIREYFKIEYCEPLGDILVALTVHLGKFIPTEVSQNKDKNLRKIMVDSLSKSDSEDIDKVYCYMVKRNKVKKDKTLGQRSTFNDNKTRLSRARLYQKLGGDTNLSFCYSKDPLEEKNDEEIISNWAQNKLKSNI